MLEGTATASGSGVIPANLFAPSAATAPSISGTVAPGETVTLDPGTYTGPPAPTVTFTLGLDGGDVTGDVSGTSYTIPAGTDGQSLTLDSTGSNGIAPDATQSVSETVQAQVTWTPADLFGAGEAGFAYDLSDLSGANTNADQSGIVPGDGNPLGYLPDTSPNSNTASQNTFSKKPTVRTNANGKHYIEFDGDDILVTVEEMSNDTWTAWMVYEADEGNFLILTRVGDGVPWLGVGVQGDSSSALISSSGVVSAQYWYDNTSFSGTRGQSWTTAQGANLAIVETVNNADRTWPEVGIGDYNNTGSVSTPGDVYAWGAINRPLTAAEKADLLAYADRVRGV